MTPREQMARCYATGYGLEIAPMTVPWPRIPRERVKFYDYLTTKQLEKMHPEHTPGTMAQVDIVGNANFLLEVPSDSQDFLAASHVLEHMEYPLGAIMAWLDVVKVGGHVLLAVPDRTETFDKDRPNTLYKDCLAQYFLGPEPTEHVVEDKHHSCWDEAAMLQFFRLTREIFGRFNIEYFAKEGFEFLVILRRTS